MLQQLPMLDSFGRCGACHACCVLVSIREGPDSAPFAKAAGEPCRYLDHGCRIYDERPPACRRFECLYHGEKEWPEAWRPDRLGLMLTAREMEGAGVVLYAHELWEGAGRANAGRELLRSLSETAPVLVVSAAQKVVGLLSADMQTAARVLEVLKRG